MGQATFEGPTVNDHSVRGKPRGCIWGLPAVASGRASLSRLRVAMRESSIDHPGSTHCVYHPGGIKTCAFALRAVFGGALLRRSPGGVVAGTATKSPMWGDRRSRSEASRPSPKSGRRRMKGLSTY